LATLDDSLPEKPTLGIVGLGNVGTKVEKLARILDMEVLLNDPPRERAEGGTHWSSFEEIVDRSDIITLHVPLNNEGEDKTHHMISEEELSRIPDNTILINTSRGEVVDNTALKKALRESRLKTAVLDVWENEPGIDLELLNQVKLGTPHIAGYSRDGKANGTAQSVRAISRFFGLGLDKWYPTDIEPPQNPVVHLNTSGKTTREILFEAIQSTYNVKDDDLRLREKPDTFEKQRGDYPVRREFNAYRLKTDPDLPDSTWQKLTELGYQVRPVREKDRKPHS
jgi:erythronate-4-phosphate dehydrogenase